MSGINLLNVPCALESWCCFCFSDAKKKFCEWNALDFSTDEPKRHHFRVQFSSASAAEEFREAFNQVSYGLSRL
jgi:hypothetical protein